ncbi:monovalent cation/H+ antiporter complex subunit F [Micrococcus luteus]|nr:monovalent cation/H+ antiporter complex subunit F [Micrococcus luteus]
MMPFAYDWSLVGIDLAIALLTVSALVSAYRIVVGPLDADRAVSGDLLTFSVLGMLVLFGVRADNPWTLDLVLIAAVVAFLSGMSLARALTRGKR